MRIPTDQEIRALHRKYAPTPDAYDLVYTHCEIVCAVAEQLIFATDIDLDAELIRAGCLLHDIGVYRLYDTAGKLDHTQYVRHGILGFELLHEAGFPDTICRFCSRHTGVGLSRADVQAQRLSLPLGDYLSETGEEELVMYADKFHSKTDPPAFFTVASAAAKLRCYGDDKAAAFQAMHEKFGEPCLEPLITKYGHALA